jgi:hypothetical protein
VRIWSIHPKYLDARGLVALWRETLLAKHVLEGKTTGYRNHPQLQRFRKLKEPVQCVNQYLSAIHEESVQRGYKFDSTKINWRFRPTKMKVSIGQLNYETRHLLKKLKARDPRRFAQINKLRSFEPHPLFSVKPGDVEDWEKR